MLALSTCSLISGGTSRLGNSSREGVAEVVEVADESNCNVVVKELT